LPRQEVKLRWYSEKIAGTFAAGICLLHAFGLVSLFAPLQGLFDAQPLIDQDWGLHFHHLNSLGAFWRQDHAVWGYNPFFMAGYPSNTIQDLSIKFFEFIALALSAVALTPLQWFKISAFAATASVPCMMYFSARNFFVADDFRNLAAVLAAALGTLYWWNSLPREMFFYGMIGFPLAAYLSVLEVSLFYRLAAHPEKLGWQQLGWVAFALVILPLHIQSIVICLPPMIVLLILQPRLLTARLLILLAATAALSLLVNAPWLMAAIAHRGDDASSTIVDQLPVFARTDPLTVFLDYFGPKGLWSFRPSFMEKGFRLVLLVLGLLGIRKLTAGDRRAVGIMLASASIALFMVTYFGALAPFMKSWQPLRFKVPLDLFLAVGAAYGATTWLIAPRASRPRLVPALLGCGLATFAINLAQTESTGRLQLRSQLIPELSAIVEWIGRETPTNARLLFEESGDESGFVYDRTYLSSLLPSLTGRQLIGGPINLYNDRHHFAEFHSGKMFKKNVQSISDEELRNYLRLYNIGAVVAFDPASIERLQSIPGLVTIEQRVGPIHLMKVNQPLTWFLAGEGKVKADFNRLELSDLKGNEVTLKFHWVEGLTAEPPTNIEPVRMADDPIPFIKLINPPSGLTLRVAR
jgi:hypothetical protein